MIGPTRMAYDRMIQHRRHHRAAGRQRAVGALIGRAHGAPAVQRAAARRS
ncbi:MAG: hypothetical protein MZW92_62855 [Comamonadaceae bacterium]|nr:hypothetical protein [Comamonadaceae bacterium]